MSKRMRMLILIVSAAVALIISCIIAAIIHYIQPGEYLIKQNPKVNSAHVDSVTASGEHYCVDGLLVTPPGGPSTLKLENCSEGFVQLKMSFQAENQRPVIGFKSFGPGSKDSFKLDIQTPVNIDILTPEGAPTNMGISMNP